jgi:hypothetical protein
MQFLFVQYHYWHAEAVHAIPSPLAFRGLIPVCRCTTLFECSFRAMFG